MEPQAHEEAGKKESERLSSRRYGEHAVGRGQTNPSKWIMRGASAQTEARRGSATVVLESRSRDRTGLGRLNHLVGLGQVPVGQRPGHARPAPREAGHKRRNCNPMSPSSGPLSTASIGETGALDGPRSGRLRWKPMSPFALLIALDHVKRKNRGRSPLHSFTIVYAFLGAEVKTPSGKMLKIRGLGRWKVAPG